MITPELFGTPHGQGRLLGCCTGRPESWGRMKADSRGRGAGKLGLGSYEPRNDSQTPTPRDTAGLRPFVKTRGGLANEAAQLPTACL